jgi:DNA-binding CsgD family transcriptional regulator
MARIASRSDTVSLSAARRLGGISHRVNREAPHPSRTRSATQVDAAFAALEKLNRGVLLLDAGGVVQFMNGAARAMLNRGHGLSLRKSRLVFAGAAEVAALESCLERKTGSLLLRVAGPNHAHGAYGVLVSPIELRDEPGGFCVFIHEPPGKQRPVPTQVLRQLYGLTAAEARLVNALYVGQSLQSAAGTGGISRNTAKTVLKRVFVKCEVGSQAELLQLLSLGPRVV